VAKASQRLLLWTLFLLPRAAWLTRPERESLQIIESAGAFDTAAYRAQRPRNLTAQLAPLRHYIVWGEKKGLWPNAGFSPHAYLANNPDLAGYRFNLLAHYLSRGQAEGRRPTVAPEITNGLPADLSILPSPRERAVIEPTHRLAVVAHLYFPDLWAELATALKQLAEPFDLYCTVTNRPDCEALPRQILADFPNAQVIPFPNHGRDIFPFVYLVNSGLLARYAAIGKIHTKKSPHVGEGDVWREQLIGGILPPAPDATRTLLDIFLDDPQLGLVAADECLLSHRHFWGPNRPRVENHLRQLALDPRNLSLRFPGGSFYWIKPEPLHLLRKLNLQAEDFEQEAGQLDGTQAHAVERLIGMLVQASGQRILGTQQLLATRSAA
jgi:lipopolysaccharide biosynthesis protein